MTKSKAVQAAEKERKAANQKRADEVKGATNVFKPKSYEELVKWYQERILTGNATKRDFLNAAKSLEGPKKGKEVGES